MATEAAAVPATSNFKLYLGWGVGTLGASLLLNGFSFLVLYYLTTVLGLGAALAGTLIGASKIWDIVTNPLMGVLSDRSETRWGRRRPFLLLGAAVSGLAFAGLYSLGTTAFADSLPVITILLIALGTGYTIFNVPYMAMPAEMLDDYHERTKLMSYRVFFIGIGTLVGGAAGQRIVELAGGGAEGYAFMGMLIGAGIFLFMAMAFFGTAKARFTLRTKVRYPFMQQLKLGLANRPFSMLLGTKFTQLFGLASNTATAVFVIRFVMEKENPGAWLLWFGVASMATQILSIPLWLQVTKLFEKRRTYIFATVLFVLASLSWLLANPAEPLWFFLLRAAIKGLAAGGLLLMGQSMLPDTIEYDYRSTGLRREGIYSGLYSIVEKAAFAISPAILGVALQFLFGFDSKTAAQSTEAVDGIRYAAAFLPALYFTLSLPFLFAYRLTEAQLRAMPDPAAARAG